MDALLAALMVGIGESYWSAFGLATGMSQVVAGLLVAIPILAGALIQIGAPLMVLRVGSYRKWVVGCASAQAACFLPLIAAALYGAIPAWGVFLLAASYWAASMATGPSWNTWIATLVPPRIRPQYFSRRSRWAQAAVLGGLLGGGIILHRFQELGRPLQGFAIIFGIASLSRFISAGVLARHSEPVPPTALKIVRPRELFSRLRSGNDAQLLLFMIAIQLAVQFAGPYFTPYMLGQLDLTYGSYMILLSISFTAKVIALPILGTFAKRVGARRLLWLGAVGIAPLAILWVPTKSFYFLLCVQVLSGIAWGAYELGAFLLLFETISDRERTSILTTFNVANALALVLGSIMGGAVIALLGADQTAYHVVFAGSTVLRAGALMLLSRVQDVEITVPQPIATRTDAVQPSTGSLERPIIASMSQSWTGVRRLGERGRRAVLDIVRPKRRE